MNSSRDALVDEIRQLNRSLSKALHIVTAQDKALAKSMKERDELIDSSDYILRHLSRALDMAPGDDDQWKVWSARARQIVTRDHPEVLAARNRLGADPEQRLERVLAELKSMAAAIERKDELSQTTMLGACPGCGRPLRDADDLSGECEHYNEFQCRGGMFGGCCSCTCSDYDD